MILCRNNMCSSEEVSRTRIVAHALVVGEELFIACSREMMDGRVLFEYSQEVSSYSFYLCLLEKYLRKPYAICSTLIIHTVVSPLQIVASMFLIPSEQRLPGKWCEESVHILNIMKTYLFTKRSYKNSIKNMHKTLYFVLQRPIELL